MTVFYIYICSFVFYWIYFTYVYYRTNRFTVLWKQTTAILKFYFWFQLWPVSRHLHLILHQHTKCRVNRSFGCDVMSIFKGHLLDENRWRCQIKCWLLGLLSTPFTDHREIWHAKVNLYGMLFHAIWSHRCIVSLLVGQKPQISPYFQIQHCVIMRPCGAETKLNAFMLQTFPVQLRRNMFLNSNALMPIPLR